LLAKKEETTYIHGRLLAFGRQREERHATSSKKEPGEIPRFAAKKLSWSKEDKEEKKTELLFRQTAIEGIPLRPSEKEEPLFKNL